MIFYIKLEKEIHLSLSLESGHREECQSKWQHSIPSLEVVF